jgi:hypothetical protein
LGAGPVAWRRGGWNRWPKCVSQAVVYSLNPSVMLAEEKNFAGLAAINRELITKNYSPAGADAVAEA